MAWTTPKTWTAAVLTVSDMNTYNRDNMNFLRANIELDAATELTISSGVITFTKSFHKVDTEGDAAADDLDTINTGAEGRILLLRAENSARTVTVKNGTGNIILRSDTDLDTQKILMLVYDGSNWIELNLVSPTYAYGSYDRAHYGRNIYS